MNPTSPLSGMKSRIVTPSLSLAISAALIAGALPVANAFAQSVEKQSASAQITVTATATEETATAPLKGYIARQGITATKTDTPITETPQSVSVITGDQIRDQAAGNLRQAFQYTPGIVATESGNVSIFSVRGFRIFAGYGSYYLDGTKYASNAFQGQQEIYGLERLELLRGPASVLYGNVEPGGIINAISKRPTLTPIHEINMEYGSFNHKALSADFAGKLTEDGNWSYRLTGKVQDSDTFTDYVPDNRTFIAPALTWAPSDATSLTLLTSYRKTHSRYVYGMPVSGTLKPLPGGKIPVQRFIGEPDAERHDEQAWTAGYEFKHRFSDTLEFSQTLRYEKSHMDFTYAYMNGYVTPDTIARGFSDRFLDSHTLTVDSGITADWGSDSFSGKTLAGFDYLRQQEDDYRRYIDDIADLNIYHPLYGTSLAGLPDDESSSEKLARQQTGIYLQNQTKIAGRVVILLGGRYDRIKYGGSPYSGTENWDFETSSKFTGRLGLVYLADNDLAPYVSFSQSFQPAEGRDRYGNRFKPMEGEQYEAGIRYQPQGSDSQITASIYQLTQNKMLTPDPDEPLRYSVQTRKARSRGFELEAKTTLMDNLFLMAGYALTTGKTVASNNPIEQGRPLEFAPRHQFSLWGYYDNLLGISGLKLGGAVRYVGSTTGFYFNRDANVPPYTLFDAMAGYSTGAWDFTLNVHNLADKHYVANCSYGCFWGEPRNITGSVRYRW